MASCSGASNIEKFADEQTANLDPTPSMEILGLLSKVNEEKQITIIMVTHSSQAAEYGEMKLQLKEGDIISK